MASVHSPSYPLGGTNTERDRLLSQAEQYEPTANWLLDQIDFSPAGEQLISVVVQSESLTCCPRASGRADQSLDSNASSASSRWRVPKSPNAD